MAAAEDDVAAHYRRQIAQVTSDKEAAKIDLESLQRTVDSHLLRLNSLLGGRDINLERLGSAIEALDADLRGRLDTSDSKINDGVVAEGTYEVLRSSLNDAQKRCHDLNSDMLRVADANDELMGTLKTLKGTNKRLVEEVQRQTEELSSLTQQRLLDMENLSSLEEKFKREKAQWQQEAKRCIDEEQARLDEEFNTMRDTHTAQLDECYRKAKSVASKAGGIRAMQSQLKTEVQGFAQNVSVHLKKLERELHEKITHATKQMHSDHQKLKDTEHNLQVKLRAEKEVRENETEAWRARHATLAKELEDVVSKRDSEVADVQSRIDALEAAREAEAASAESDRSRLHEHLESHAKEAALLDAMTQTAKRKVLQLESRVAQADGERDRLQRAAETLRQQIRESDDALNEAVRSNEALREQMEIQRLDAHHANERDLKLCREMYEKRLELTAQSHASEHADLAKRIRAAEEAIGTKAGDLQAARELLGAQQRKREALQRDVLVWKAQHDLSHKLKADVEKEASQFRQDCLDGELQRHQEQHDELVSKKADLELHKSQLVEEVNQAKKAAAAREASDKAHAAALADEKREAEEELLKLRQHHGEMENALASAKSEHAKMTQHLSERRDALEQELARLNSELDAEKREFERKVQNERSTCENLRDSVEKLRAEHRASYKAASDGPVQQIAALESAISDIQRSSDVELTSLRHKYEKNRLRADELETELVRMQAKLEQTEQEVQDSTTRVNTSKANFRRTKDALERERLQKKDELEQVQRAVAQKQEQMKNLMRVGEDTRRRMLRDVEDAKAARAKQLAEADGRMQALKTEYAMALEDSGYPRTASTTVPLAHGTGASSPLGRYGMSMGMGDSADSVRRTLTSMEDRAAELRRGLQ